MSADAFTRTIRVQPSEGELGRFRAVLATDGEASDGHVLAIKGGEVAPGLPLLFGHDGWSGRANLGTWARFQKTAHELVGDAEIELAGAGEQREWREDLATMIQKKRIRNVSIRWEPIGKPIRRTALPAAHPAFVDAERETDWRKLEGLFFPRWRALEGSVVTLGSDRDALIERARSSSGRLAEFWRSAASEYGAASDLDQTTAPDPELERAIADLEAELEAEAVELEDQGEESPEVAGDETREVATVAALSFDEIATRARHLIREELERTQREIERLSVELLRSALGRG